MTHHWTYFASAVALSLCINPFALAQTCTPAPSGLVSWWTGDTNENDITGGNNPAAVNAVTLVPGEVQSGFTFGNDGYIQIPPSANLENQQYTWATWVRPDGPGSTNDQYGSVIVVQNSDLYGDVFALDWRSNPDSRFLFVFGNQQSETVYSAHTFPAGVFYFVAATYDGSTFRLFVNGVLEGSFAESKTIPYDSSPWVIGESFIARPNFRRWNGVIDEVQAFNRALDASELLTLFNAGASGVCKGLDFSPPSLKFPRRTINTTSPPLPVTVNNALPIAVTFGKISVSGDFAQTNTCPSPGGVLASGTACSVSVTFTPTAPGTRTGRVTIGDSAPANPQRINLSGAATDIAFSPQRLSFGSVTVGGAGAVKGVNVFNQGTTTVTITGVGIVIVGANASDFQMVSNTCGSSIAPGAHCTVGVRFRPTTAGAKTAALNVNDDGGASPQIVPLSGTGTP
jgi:hypothetical protein